MGQYKKDCEECRGLIMADGWFCDGCGRGSELAALRAEVARLRAWQPIATLPSEGRAGDAVAVVNIDRPSYSEVIVWDTGSEGTPGRENDWPAGWYPDEQLDVYTHWFPLPGVGEDTDGTE